MPVIGIFAMIIVAFNNVFMSLLYKREDAFFEEQYEGVVNSTANLTMSDVSSSNDFNNAFKAFSDVWFIIYGVWDPINNSDSGDNVMVHVMAIIFYFITVLIFFNMLIALMSGTVEKVTADGDASWLNHFSALVSEIEMVWCTESESHSRVNNPQLDLLPSK